MSTKRKSKFAPRLDWATELRVIDEEMEVLVSRRKEIMQEVEKWQADCAENAAKPEEIDPLFCDIKEPCEQTFTMVTYEGVAQKAWKEHLDEEVNTLFCSSETKECEVIPWKIEPRKSIIPDGIKITPGEPLVLAKDRHYAWLVEKPKTEAYIENKISHCQRIRKYLSEQWQQVKTNFLT